MAQPSPVVRRSAYNWQPHWVSRLGWARFTFSMSRRSDCTAETREAHQYLHDLRDLGNTILVVEHDPR